MSAEAWLILLLIHATTWLLLGVLWFSLDQKLSALLSVKSQKVSGGYEPMPEMFVLTDQEAYQAEQTLEQESRDRSLQLKHSGRNFSAAR
jgi:hypothetical protein